MYPTKESNNQSSSYIDLNSELSSYREELESHKIYQKLKSVSDIRTFMEIHVFAVWDFMSILKALQMQLTNISIPWTPNNNPLIVRFINEIVYGEESDINELGEPKSHFEMYLDAMKQVGANRKYIDKLLDMIQSGNNIDFSLNQINIDKRIKEFTQFTFSIINTKKPHSIGSAFTFGREDIIPDMFIKILDGIDPKAVHFSKLKYYLERHIEIDGDLHGPLALRMMDELCGNNPKKWDEALIVAKKCIQHRIQLWDVVVELLNQKNQISKNNLTLTG
tara:strand:- start:164 stop:997 length:834 start_codon:yes stop_codon:yes gene_type:complete